MKLYMKPCRFHWFWCLLCVVAGHEVNSGRYHWASPKQCDRCFLILEPPGNEYGSEELRHAIARVERQGTQPK